MKKFILILVFFGTFLESANLHVLTGVVRHEIQKNIYIDEDVDLYDIFIEDLPIRPKVGELFDLYKMVLDKHGFELLHDKVNDFYYVVKISPESTRFKNYVYKVQNLTVDDIKELLTIFPKLNYRYLSQSDMVVFSTTKEKSEKILMLLNVADSQLTQERVRISIINTNTSTIKEAGTKIDKIGFTFQHYVDLLLGLPTHTSSDIKNIGEFNAFLTYLDTDGLTDIEQSPTILLRDGVKAQFKSVTNIPYLSQTQEVTDTRTNNIESLVYKDVGLEVVVVPKMRENFIYLDITLTVENLLTDKSDIRPVTQKIFYTNHIRLEKGKAVVLTGLKKQFHTVDGFKVPLLGDIPYLNALFNYELDSSETESITILVESLDS